MNIQTKKIDARPAGGNGRHREEKNVKLVEWDLKIYQKVFLEPQQWA